ncbi:hypothetical protein PRZ48_008931 [Zasmidium cellare]|uniref:Cytochrome P450 n=1 Tax=Zasmidium cellare TaxID=395010 RepID=A0ABR0EHN2_ZASCE|nr:hypothetical protein PRZ48_008931 [Zasmidium cellare]
MLADHSLTFVYSLAIILILTSIYNYLTSPLRAIPGPLFARFSRLWYLFNISSGHFEKSTASLHTRHGKIVRLSPNQYSINDPTAFQTIYKSRPEFRKSDFYAAWETPGKLNIFTQRDVATHARDRKKFHAAYTMSTMTTYKKYVDDCVSILCQRLEERMGQEVDMAWWLQCFAFDVIGEISYSKRFGFLDKCEDQEGLIENVGRTTRYSLVMGVVPEWHGFCFGVLVLLGRMGVGKGAGKKFLRDFTLKSLEEKQEALEKGREEDGDDKPKDFMTKFIEQNHSDPSTFTLDDAINGVMGNINAGSDTTGVALSAIVYYLVSTPSALQKLRDELSQHQVSDPITFKEAQSLPYLQAVIKEAMRLHPSIAVQLPRVVPEGGTTIAGQFFPAGTVVGVNPYVLHRDKDVYGEDAETFRPERWLKSDTDPETLARMESSWCPFGAGSRTCIGRNVSLLEISKLVPELVRRFEFEMGGELERDGLRTRGEFFLHVENLRLRVWRLRG